MNELDKALEAIVESGLSTEEVLVKLDKLKKQWEVNYIFRDSKHCLCIDECGKIENYYSNDEALENFNAFPLDKRKLAEYIARKQKLERALLIYSDLHGAEKIGWNNAEQAKYLISSSYDGENIITHTIYMNECNWIDDIYFHNREAAEKAIEIYKDEIKEVLKLQRELYKVDSKTRK